MGLGDLFNFELKFTTGVQAGLRPCTPPAGQVSPSRAQIGAIPLFKFTRGYSNY
jgi:hypothetical protein